MKFFIALALFVTSSLSFAQHVDPVIEAVIHDIRNTEISCDWTDMLNTMSDFEAQYHITSLLGGLRTTYTVNNNVINAESISVGETQRLFTKIVLNKDFTRVSKVDFLLQKVEKYTVNSGTIFKPSYEDHYRVKYSYSASCIVR